MSQPIISLTTVSRATSSAPGASSRGFSSSGTFKLLPVKSFEPLDGVGLWQIPHDGQSLDLLWPDTVISLRVAFIAAGDAVLVGVFAAQVARQNALQRYGVAVPAVVA